MNLSLFVSCVVVDSHFYNIFWFCFAYLFGFCCFSLLINLFILYLLPVCECVCWECKLPFSFFAHDHFVLLETHQTILLCLFLALSSNIFLFDLNFVFISFGLFSYLSFFTLLNFIWTITCCFCLFYLFFSCLLRSHFLLLSCDARERVFCVSVCNLFILYIFLNIFKIQSVLKSSKKMNINKNTVRKFR